MYAVTLQWQSNGRDGDLPRVDVEQASDPTEVREILDRRLVFDTRDEAERYARLYGWTPDTEMVV